MASIEASALGKVGLFAGLTRQELVLVAPACSRQSLVRNQTVVSEGGPATHLYWIEQGQVVIRKATGEGPGAHQAIVRPYGPGDLFGWTAIYGGTMAVSAVARQPSILVAVDGQRLRRLMDANPSLGYKVMLALARHIVASARDLIDAFMAQRALVIAEAHKRAAAKTPRRAG
jgi:CRP-like cAMP-binding protein